MVTSISLKRPAVIICDIYRENFRWLLKPNRYKVSQIDLHESEVHTRSQTIHYRKKEIIILIANFKGVLFSSGQLVIKRK